MGLQPTSSRLGAGVLSLDYLATPSTLHDKYTLFYNINQGVYCNTIVTVLEKGFEPLSLAAVASKTTVYTVPPSEHMDTEGFEPPTFAV